MKMASLRVLNFRCCKEVEIKIQSMHALVGANNAGKSTILRALDFFFNPAAGKISEESFWCTDTTLEIRVEVHFVDLTPEEKETMRGYLKADSTFHMARTAKVVTDDEGETKIAISQECNVPSAKHEWLVKDNINGANVAAWWKEKDKLVGGGKSFADFLGHTGAKAPAVKTWEEKAREFAATLPASELADKWSDNPKGYPAVLKSCIPHYELIPAVRDAMDESKVLKTNPFGRLIHEVIDSLGVDVKGDIDIKLAEIAKRLNRSGEKERLQNIIDLEEQMKKHLSELMPADLEIEFKPPSVELLLTTPKIYIDDGYRGSIDGKGHGLQRAVIFSILRAYSEQAAKKKSKRTLILGIEEPELYMHPTAQRTVRKVLRQIASAGDQVFFTTHSPLLVDVTYFDEIIRVETEVAEQDGKKVVNARLFQITIGQILEDLKARHPTVNATEDSVREKYAHAYTSSRNEGFFAKQIILVEGQTETYCLPIYARGLEKELDMLGVAVVECQGKDSIDRLYRIFNELGIPSYVLFDYDYGNADALESSKSLLKFLKHEENVVSHTHNDRFSCFHTKWETALRAETENHDTLAADATRYFGKCSSKPLEARYIATKLVNQTPPFVPPTVKKILEHALNVKCVGSCLARPAAPS